jgi:hypothetical protein
VVILLANVSFHERSPLKYIECGYSFSPMRPKNEHLRMYTNHGFFTSIEVIALSQGKGAVDALAICTLRLTVARNRVDRGQPGGLFLA